MGGVSVNRLNRWHGKRLVALALVSWLALSLSQVVGESADLPKIGPAPAFSLTTQEGARLTLQDLRGKVVAVTFIYASCADTCPLLTAKLAGLQARLGTDFGTKVFFVAITVDPERDTPQVLKGYAQAHGANLAGWAFLTGTPAGPCASNTWWCVLIPMSCCVTCRPLCRRRPSHDPVVTPAGGATAGERACQTPGGLPGHCRSARHRQCRWPGRVRQDQPPRRRAYHPAS